MSDQPSQDWRGGDPIGYIQPDIPEVQTHPYSGQRYEVLVPDTYDLQHRARLVIHAMTETTDPQADYEPYYMVFFRTNPPVMVHCSWHAATFAKYLEAVTLMRLVSGSDQNLHVEQRWMQVALKCQGPDGLIHIPNRGRPWSFWSTPIDNPVRDGDVYGARTGGDHQLSAFGCGRMLSAMALLAIRDGGPLWRDATRRLVDGLGQLAVDRGDFAFYWPHVLLTSKESPPADEVPDHELNFDGYSRVVHGLVHAHRLLDYQPAMSLAPKLVNYMRRYYDHDGSFLAKPGTHHKAHFHAHTNSLLSMLEYGRTVDDHDLIDFVVRSFGCAKDYVANFDRTGDKRPGANLVGYFPEHVNSPEWEGSELCEVSDMIALALKMSDAGIADCWDDADRWIRNMFAEGQLLSTDWIGRFRESGLVNPEPESLSQSIVDAYSTTERVAERNLGAFAGWPAANDWYVGNGSGIGHCCTVNGARAIYWIWQYALRHDNGALRVNLLFNRASPWADVDSHLPYCGRVDVKIKQPVNLNVRLPQWVAPADVRAQVDGVDRSLDWSGRYAEVGAVTPGQVASLTFPISEASHIVHIEKQRFTLVCKGHDVVAIDPPGAHHPLYQRQHCRNGGTRWRSVERFVTNDFVEW